MEYITRVTRPDQLWPLLEATVLELGSFSHIEGGHKPADLWGQDIMTWSLLRLARGLLLLLQNVIISLIFTTPISNILPPKIFQVFLKSAKV